MSEYKTYTESNQITFNEYLAKVFEFLSIGLGITTIIAIGTTMISRTLLYSNEGLLFFLSFGSCIAELIVCLIFTSRLQTMSITGCWTCYAIYSILTGVSLSSILIFYSNTTIWLAFGVCMIMFASMAYIGKTSNLDFTKVGSYVLPPLFAIIISTLINALFIRSEFFDWILTYIGIIIFLVLIAYDIQRLRSFYNESLYNDDLKERLMIMGAFQLYLDFINLFIRIIRIFGRRKD